MTKKIIDFPQRPRNQDRSSAGFLTCPVCQATSFAVICSVTAELSSVDAIVCVTCDPPRRLGVENGILQ